MKNGISCNIPAKRDSIIDKFMKDGSVILARKSDNRGFSINSRDDFGVDIAGAVLHMDGDGMTVELSWSVIERHFEIYVPYVQH